MPDWLQKLQAIQIVNEDNSTSLSLDIGTTQCEEWMILSDFHLPFSNHQSNNSADHTAYWQMGQENYTAQQIDEKPTWIRNCKRYQ